MGTNSWSLRRGPSSGVRHCRGVFFGALAGILLVASVAFGLRWVERGVVAGQERGARGLAALPEAARGPISRSLGRGDPAFYARYGAGGVRLVNRGQRFDASFSSAGVRVRSGGARLGLQLLGVGHGQALRSAGLAVPEASANRVAYRRRALTEWYANGPLGLEQGFTLRSRPGGRGAGPLTLELALSGNLRAVLERGGEGLSLTGAGVSLRYAGLIARDARGRQLGARLELRGRDVLVRVDDAGVRYPITIDPFVQQAELTASDGASLTSVAVSGNTLVVAGSGAQGGYQPGAVYVFTKPAGGWGDATQTAKLTASDGVTGDALGASVAVEGDLVVAGAPGRSVGTHAGQGAVYVFTKPAGGWADETQAAKLTASDGAAGDAMGASVAVSGDTVVAGACGPSPVSFETPLKGAAYVFTKPAGGWANENQAAKLTASDGVTGDALGASVAVSGNTVVAGAPGSLTASGPNGVHRAVYVFTQPPGGWANETQSAKLTSSDGNGFDLFGFSVGVSGSTVVAGAIEADGMKLSTGAAYVFLRPASGWANETQAAKLVASDGEGGDLLGWSVAVAPDDTVIVGAPRFGGNGITQGAAYVFTRPAGGWGGERTQAAELTASNGHGLDSFGVSVAFASNTAAVSAPGIGPAYVFGANAPLK